MAPSTRGDALGEVLCEQRILACAKRRVQPPRWKTKVLTKPISPNLYAEKLFKETELRHASFKHM